MKIEPFVECAICGKVPHIIKHHDLYYSRCGCITGEQLENIMKAEEWRVNYVSANEMEILARKVRNLEKLILIIGTNKNNEVQPNQ
jgi:hypothetical protein